MRQPYWFKLLFGYLFVLISAIPFYFGYQIHPVDNVYHQYDMDPECLSIQQIGHYIDRNFFNLSYCLNTKDMTTRDISFSLFRIIVNGQFYKEELRRGNSDNIFQFQNDYYTISYELFQEGHTNLTIKCLDRIMFHKDFDLNDIQSNKYTIFHKDDSISNVCFSKGTKIIFGRNNVKNFSSKIMTSLTPFTYVNTTAEKFISENNNQFQLLSYPVIDIYQKTTFELISGVLPFAFYLSKGNNDPQYFNAFKLNSNLKDSSNLTEFIQSIVKEPLIPTDSPFTDYCYLGNNERFFNFPISHKFETKTIKYNSKRSIQKDELDDQVDSIHDSFKEHLLSKYGNKDDNKLREKPKILFSINSNEDYSNLDGLKALVNSSWDLKIVKLSELSLQQKIFEISDAKVMICLDDGDEVSNAVWMKEDSVLILIHAKNMMVSDAVKFVESRKIEVSLVDFYLDNENLNGISQKVEIPLKTIEMILKDL